MQNRPGNLPPLDYLLAFEAAAKFESFSKASSVLEISESAISRKIRLLETHFEVPFFRRGNKSVTLTPQGRVFFEKIQGVMDNLRDISSDLIAQKDRNEIKLAATNSVASLWLLPRLRKFNQANAQMTITLVASDDDSECLSDAMDLSILRGDGNWPDHSSQKLFGEIIFPVCSPIFLEKNPQASDLNYYNDLPLIEVSSNHSEWMSWNEWLEGHLHKPPSVIGNSVFNAYPHAIQAAVDGLGIALGWGHLVDHLLESGDLVRPLGKTHTRTEFGYFLLQRTKRNTSPVCATVEDWLLAESAVRTAYSKRRITGIKKSKQK